MKTICVIIVPLSGVDGTEKGDIFERLIDECINLTDYPPIVVIDTKSVWFGNDVRVRKLSLNKRIILVERLCVDTCQMWLEGWNHVFSLDGSENIERIVLLPGDLVKISNPIDFFNGLDLFINATSPKMLIGQFQVEEANSGKALIDQYGVYPLLANWFPNVSRLIHGERIERPRSEFLNMDAKLLKKLLEKRSFAYEQTLNMIIRIVETPADVGLVPPKPDELIEHWFHSHVRIMKLGKVSDDSSSTAFLGCLDQIERTDRLLRFVWRELNKLPTVSDKEYRDFLSEFSSLSRTSSEVRHAAIVAIRALLGT